MREKLEEICKDLGLSLPKGNLQVFSPLDSSEIASIQSHSAADVDAVIASAATSNWSGLTLEQRAGELLKFADAVEAKADSLTQLVRIDAGKTTSEAAGEVGNFVSTIRSNCEAATSKKLDDLGIMTRKKSYIPVGVVALITSFNFPLAVAGWTIAPAMLVGNAVVWKPSEKTPLVALAIQQVWNDTIGGGDLQVVNGAAETGKALVENANIGMVSATGSVGMSQAILRGYRKSVPPILEAGGNNAMIISNQNSAENLEFALESLLKSFLAGSGQKCTNTRRLFVHADVYESFVQELKTAIEQFVASEEIGADNAKHGYCPLIDSSSYDIFVSTIAAATEQGGTVHLGEKVESEGIYVQPALAEMPSQTKIMHEECFAPLLFIVKYNEFAEALEQVNAPKNAGLVNAIYTQSRAEADDFAARNEAGHTVINSATGTGTPAHGMGFGGNKDSGTGEILNAEDQLHPFAKAASRVATNSSIKLS